MLRKGKAFTLLELLAAITLLVILGSMLFQIFGKSAEVVRISNARQEVFQYARAGLEFVERELIGAFTSVDANPAAGNKGMLVYATGNMNGLKRDDSQGIFFSTAILARDVSGTEATNPLYGHDVNVARIAYYLNRGPEGEPNDFEGTAAYGRLEKAAVYRYEAYDLTVGNPGQGNPFVRNCLYFNVDVMSRFSVGSEKNDRFLEMNWDSEDTVTVGGHTRRRGLPQALRVEMRITDEVHARRYRWRASEKKWVVPGIDPLKDYWGEEDPVVRSFSQIVYYGRRSD